MINFATCNGKQDVADCECTMKMKFDRQWLAGLCQRASNFLQRRANLLRRSDADLLGQSESDQLGQSGTSVHAPTESRPTSVVVEQLLADLGCKFDVDKQDDSINYRFSYQGGYFLLTVANESLPVVSLSFPYIYSVPVDKINVLRITCNVFNLRTNFSHFAYSFSEERNEFSVHVHTPLMLFDGMPDGDTYFQALLNSQFTMRRDFESEYEDNDKKFGQNSDTDKDAAYSQRISFLMHEQELRHQSELFQIRQAPGSSFRLDDVLKLCFGLPTIDYAYLRIVRDEQVQLEFDVEHICNIDIKAEPGDVTYSVYFTDPSTHLTALRQIMVQVTVEADDDEATYKRVTAVMFPPVMGSDVSLISGRQFLSDLTFLIAIDKQDEPAHRREYEYVWGDAIEKVQQDKADELTEEQRLLVMADSPDVGFYLFRGQRLYAQGRYYEAIDLLLVAYGYLSDSYAVITTDQLHVFREICFYVGSAYMELHFFADAYYYLSQLREVNNTRYAEAYINCLVNGHDVRARSELERIMGYVSNYMLQAEEENDEVPSEIHAFHQFLRRRQVYVLINNDDFKRARDILGDMLNEPSNVDFAIGELAYLQKLLKARGKELPEAGADDELPF